MSIGCARAVVTHVCVEFDCSSMAPRPSQRGLEEPVPGDRILVLTPAWMEMVLQKKKTYEVRHAKLRGGKWYLGCKGTIYAQCSLGPALLVETLRQWKRLQPFHKHSSRELPYAKTFVMRIEYLHELRRRYRHPRGAIGIVTYRGPP